MAFAEPPAPTVVIDGWWSGDFADKACRAAKAWMKDNGALVNQLGCEPVAGCDGIMPQFVACLVHDAHIESRSFEGRLMTRFRFNPKCKGGTFAIFFDSPSNKAPEQQPVLNNPHWTLRIDYTLGQQRQGWKLDYVAKQSSIHREGRGTDVKIADRVCSIINGLGGDVVR